MSEKYTVKISLCVLGLNNLTAEYNILSVDPETLILPFIELDNNNNITKILEDICKRHIDLDTNWIQYKILDAIVENDTILVLYRCMIPLDTKVLDTYWIPSWKCIHNPLTPIILNSL